MMNDTSTPSARGSIERIFQIIEYIASSNSPRGLNRISEDLHLNRATANNILKSLHSIGYLEKHGSKYALSGKMYMVGSSFFANNPMVRVLRRFDTILSPQLNCSFHLFVMGENHEPKLLYSSEAMDRDYNGNPFLVMLPGTTFPLYATAAGKIFLAFAQRGVYASFWESTHPLVSLTSKTIISKEKLYKQIELIRQQQYAVENGEFSSDNACISVPVFDGCAHKLVAALSAGVPANSLVKADFPPRIVETLHRLSKAIELELESQRHQRPLEDIVP